MDYLILIGGGGHCKSVIDVVETENKYKIEGILDLQENIGRSILSYPIIGTDDDIPKLVSKNLFFFITIGQIKNYTTRKKLFCSLLELGAKVPVIVSPNAYVSKHNSLGRGTIIHHHVIINAGVAIGENTIINTGAIIEHETLIGNNCHISTNSVINGQCIVEDDCFIGSNAVLKNNIIINKGSIIGAGAVVLNNIAKNTIAFGNPARKQKS